MKLYIVSNTENGIDNIDGVYYLISEDGECLYSHWCSSKGFAKGDLIENRPERIEECKKFYGEYEVLYLGEDEMTNEELLKRNKENGESEE